MNFLPIKQSKELKELGIVIDTEFVYHEKNASGDTFSKKYYNHDGTETTLCGSKIIAPAPTATEMLGIMPVVIEGHFINIYYTGKSWIIEFIYACQDEDYVSIGDNHQENIHLLIALSDMLKWLKQERYI